VEDEKWGKAATLNTPQMGKRRLTGGKSKDSFLNRLIKEKERALTGWTSLRNKYRIIADKEGNDKKRRREQVCEGRRAADQ